MQSYPLHIISRLDHSYHTSFEHLGCLEGELVKCTLHGSRFSVRTGEPQEEPAEEPLRTYPVRVEGIDVLVRI